MGGGDRYPSAPELPPVWGVMGAFGRAILADAQEAGTEAMTTKATSARNQKQHLSTEERDHLLRVLKDRFERNRKRHEGLEWAQVASKLEGNSEKLRSIQEMEKTGGEPDVIGRDAATGEFIFCDCSAESPKGRRSICYDREALDSRKENKPADGALDMAAAMGIEILTEAEYRELQKLGNFDTKTSSWVKTPANIRKLGGAVFCDRRYNTVFLYHNGAESYYGARGFRGSVRV